MVGGCELPTDSGVGDGPQLPEAKHGDFCPQDTPKGSLKLRNDSRLT